MNGSDYIPVIPVNISVNNKRTIYANFIVASIKLGIISSVYLIIILFETIITSVNDFNKGSSPYSSGLRAGADV